MGKLISYESYALLRHVPHIWGRSGQDMVSQIQFFYGIVVCSEFPIQAPSQSLFWLYRSDEY